LFFDVSSVSAQIAVAKAGRAYQMQGRTRLTRSHDRATGKWMHRPRNYSGGKA